jgi:hypothetical protein
MELTTSVGFITTAATVVTIPDASFGQDTSGAIVLDDGSEIVSGGYFASSAFDVNGALAITGGVGGFRGLAGEIAFNTDLKARVIEASFICV